MCIKGFVYHLCHDSHLGCVRLGNSDLDFEIRISDFAIEHELRKWISLREICRQGGFQLRNPNPDFMDFLFTVRLGNPKKDLQNYSREQWSSFYKLCVHVQDRCSKEQSFKSFFGYPKRTKEIQEQISQR